MRSVRQTFHGRLTNQPVDADGVVRRATYQPKNDDPRRWPN
jgi:hypothetical protein